MRGDLALTVEHGKVVALERREGYPVAARDAGAPPTGLGAGNGFRRHGAQ